MTRLAALLAVLAALLAVLALAGCRLESRTAPPPEADALARTAGEAGVTVYVTEWCPYCRATQEYLDARGVAYRAVDIESSEEAYGEYAREGGTGSIPLIVVGEERMQGFQEAALEGLLQRNGI